MQSWYFKYLASSIGKKQVMGLAGVLLAGFLLVHGVGNLALLNLDPAQAQKAYNLYTEFLTHKLRPLIWFAELGLGGIFFAHVLTALKLKLENRKAAGATRYAVASNLGEGLPSRTMFLTGALILVFLVQHVSNFKYGTHYLYHHEGAVIRDMWLTTVQTFANPVWTALYAAAVVLAGLHLWHALPSFCRTFGLASRKWTPVLTVCGRLAALGLAGLFLVSALGTCALARTVSWQKQLDAARAANHLTAEAAK